MSSTTDWWMATCISNTLKFGQKHRLNMMHFGARGLDNIFENSEYFFHSLVSSCLAEKAVGVHVFYRCFKKCKKNCQYCKNFNFDKRTLLRK